MLQNWRPYARQYDPLKAGSIDGTDTQPHDKAVSRAMLMHYEPPHDLDSKPERTIFVARLGPKITNCDLKEVIFIKQYIWQYYCTPYIILCKAQIVIVQFFGKHGDVISAKVIVDVVTGISQGYGFVEMKSEEEARRALRRITNATLKGHKIFIDYECGRTLKGWKPRRLGM